jgi:hypothetical protein
MGGIGAKSMRWVGAALSCFLVPMVSFQLLAAAFFFCVVLFAVRVSELSRL